MSRVHQPDTLVSELREIQRRLRLLEGSAPRAAALLTMTAAASSGPGEPLTPARPRDWPGTESTEWEPLLRAFAPGGPLRLIVESVSDAGTTGGVRLLLDGDPFGEEWETTESVTRESVELAAENHPTEIVVEGRRGSGTGSVRVTAFILPPR